jgi:cytochrome c biogenesis protein CcmG/thiol:disulfide interchange protein DsbE
MTGIIYGDSASNARAFDTQYGITYPNVMDPDGRAAISYGVSGVPETFVVAPDGRIAAHIVGGVGANTLDQVMARLGQSSGPISLQGPGYESKP